MIFSIRSHCHLTFYWINQWRWRWQKTVVRLYDGAGSNRWGATPQHVQNCDSCATWGLLATRVRAKTKNLITLAGLRPEVTSLTWNNTSTKIDRHQVHWFSVFSNLLIWVFDTCFWRCLMLRFCTAGFEGHWDWDL